MWDVIIVGSGIGGLASAAALAKRGRRVLLLEQHSVAGGQTQTFRRGEWEFATGVHYVSGIGDPQSPGLFGRLLDGLTDGALQFAPCANPYDIIRLPGFEFGIPHPESAYRQALLAAFPGEAGTIDRWFDSCRDARRAGQALMMQHHLPSWMAWFVRLLRRPHADRWLQRTLANELEQVPDARLRAVLGARWGDYGAPPEQAPFIEHAWVTGAYDGGAFYPVGGPARFAQTLLPALATAGGQCRLRADVTRILVEQGRAVGVEVVENGQARLEHAPTVISDVGVANTLRCLDPGVGEAWSRSLKSLQPGPGFVALYIGLEGDIASAGASSANHWIYESEDIGRLWKNPADEDAPGLFVSFPSMKDPSPGVAPTAEVLALVDSSAFAAWLGEADSGPDYDAFKEWVAERLLAQFKRHFPQLAPMVRFHEAATPLTQRRFVRADGGAMYGIEMSVGRMRSDDLGTRTPISGLLLAGQDTAGPGIEAAFMSGLMAAAHVDPALWQTLRSQSLRSSDGNGQRKR